MGVTVRQITDLERNYWDREIQNFEFVHPLNAYGWGNVRKVDNWGTIHIVAERSGEFCGGMMILIKRIALTPFSILYCPRGPVWNYDDDETLQSLLLEVKKISKKEKAIFLRIDPSIPEDLIASKGDKFSSLGFIHLDKRWTFWNTPRDVARVKLDSLDTVDDYLNLLHRDTRRCIRKARKDGVSIEIATDKKEHKVFYNIFKEFSVNKGFMSRGYEYQERLWDEFIERGFGRLFLAKYKDTVIGGLLCILFGKKCLAMHMGTPYKYNKLHSSYAYVYESIKWAKENGCAWYSFRGVGTTPSQEYFKRKFKPEVVNLIGYYDLPFRLNSYNIFNFMEFSILPRAWSGMIKVRKQYYEIKKKIGKL